MMRLDKLKLTVLGHLFALIPSIGTSQNISIIPNSYDVSRLDGVSFLGYIEGFPFADVSGFTTEFFWSGLKEIYRDGVKLNAADFKLQAANRIRSTGPGWCSMRCEYLQGGISSASSSIMMPGQYAAIIDFSLALRPNSSPNSAFYWRSFYPTAEFDWEVRGLPTVYLDFDNGPNREFYKVEQVGNKLEAGFGVRAGTHPSAVFDANARSKVVSSVQEIFDRSGLKVLVTDSKPSYKPDITVKYGASFLKADGSYLGGLAYDVLPRGRAAYGVDQFNRRKDGEVAVLMSPQDGFSVEKIAEVTAHEVGHGFGVSHVYAEGHPEEAMDYEFHGAPVFSAVPLDRVEPPALGADQERDGSTQNPLYHIRRYVVGESASEIGLIPGTWDIEPSRFLGITFSLNGFGTSAAGLSVGVYGSGGSSFGEVSGYTYFSLDDFIDDYGLIRFDVEQGSRIKIVGSAGNSGLMDVLFIPDSAIGDDFSFVVSSASAFSGKVAKFDPGSGQFFEIGSFGANVQAVPEPSRLAQLIFGSVLLFFFARRRRSK
jgi:hypothetical protein